MILFPRQKPFRKTALLNYNKKKQFLLLFFQSFFLTEIDPEHR